MSKVFFDTSLNVFVETILKYVSQDTLEMSAIIRDINGQLGVVLACRITEDEKIEIATELFNNLDKYAQPYSPVSDLDDFNSDELLKEAHSISPILCKKHKIHLLDRRAVGIDWMTNPSVPRVGTLPCYVFSSIKGGVGRSTALCVVAAHLSRRGRRVLAIDFDLEAPGIGSMLLNEKELPRFGSLDFLVESQVRGFDETLIEQLIGNSYLGAAGARVDVIPAIGGATLENPQNALAKIARAYLEMPSEVEGQQISIGGKLKRLIELCEATGHYDVVLVDSRAGLHETTAAALLALGGELLLFGTNQPQTFQGYELLFAHLAQFPSQNDYDWRDRVNFVHAKAGRTDKAKAEVRDKFQEIYRLVSNSLEIKNQEIDQSLGKDDINIEWADSTDDLPIVEVTDCKILHLIDDGLYSDFDPILKKELLDPSCYESTFKDLINFFDEELSVIAEAI